MFWVQKFVDPINFGIKKILCPKKIVSKNKYWVQNILGWKKKFGQKFQVQKNLSKKFRIGSVIADIMLKWTYVN